MPGDCYYSGSRMGVADHLTGTALREAREHAHLSQEEAAAKLNVSLRTYRYWESDSPPVPHPRHRRALLAFIAGLNGVAA